MILISLLNEHRQFIESDKIWDQIELMVIE